MSDNSVSGTLSTMILTIVIIVTLTTTATYSAVTFATEPSSTGTTTTSTTGGTGTSTTQTSRPPPAIDGQFDAGGLCQLVLTTSNANDVIVLFEGGENVGPVVSVKDTAGLSWHHRSGVGYNYSATLVDTLEEWYAISVAPLTGDKIVVNTTSSGAIHCNVVGISGANTASPFDPSKGCGSGTAVPQAAGSSSLTTSGGVTLCTSNADDLLLAFGFMRGNGIGSFPSGFTPLAGGGLNSFNEAYQQVSAKQANLSVAWTLGGDAWGVIGDAITADSP